MAGQGASINNMLRNGNFSAYGTDWLTLNNVDYSRQYCRVLTGQASQVVTVTPETTYSLKFWSQVVFKGKGVLQLRSNTPSADLHFPLDDFHFWTPQEVTYTTPPLGTILTVAISGTAGEVCVDELVLTRDTGTPVRPELVLNGDFSESGRHWIASGREAIFDGRTFQATLNAQAQQAITVTPGQTYEFSIRSLSNFGGHGFVRFELSGPGTLPQIRVDTPAWSTHPQDLLIPAGTNTLTIIMIGVDGEIHFDDVSLKRKP
ncbi:hypothetical protein ICY20_17370 [Pseudomonas sp. P115]|uniref:hypothetical protein n=1 Tax=Pseudomonas pisciculturae TaxID=2730413 RepID=UPI0018920CE1|nr:hypothetical protein [Pseudomonas pisciculturae]MBF6029521.1 hypothetical protein [Pseudomonas pisciculturae]